MGIVASQPEPTESVLAVILSVLEEGPLLRCKPVTELGECTRAGELRSARIIAKPGTALIGTRPR